MPAPGGTWELINRVWCLSCTGATCDSRSCMRVYLRCLKGQQVSGIQQSPRCTQLWKWGGKMKNQISVLRPFLGPSLAGAAREDMCFKGLLAGGFHSGFLLGGFGWETWAVLGNRVRAPICRAQGPVLLSAFSAGPEEPFWVSLNTWNWFGSCCAFLYICWDGGWWRGLERNKSSD